MTTIVDCQDPVTGAFQDFDAPCLHSVYALNGCTRVCNGSISLTAIAGQQGVIYTIKTMSLTMTSSNSSITSSFFIRIQPAETGSPIRFSSEVP